MKKLLNKTIVFFCFLFPVSCINNDMCNISKYKEFNSLKFPIGNKDKTYSFIVLDYNEAIKCAQNNNKDIIFLFTDLGSSYRLWMINIPDTSVFFKEVQNCLLICMPLDIKNKLFYNDFVIDNNDTIKNNPKKNNYIFRKKYKQKYISDVILKTDKNGNLKKVLLTPENW